MTQWGLAAAIAKLPNIDAIVMDLITRQRHYEIKEVIATRDKMSSVLGLDD